MRRSVAVSTAVSLVSLALTLPCALAAAAAEPSHWLKPTTGLAPYGAADIRVGVTGDLAVAIFENGGLQATARRAGGNWEQPLALTPGIGGFYSPQLAVDGNGNAVVTLIMSLAGPGGGSRVVSYVRSAATSSWAGPTPISGVAWANDKEDLALNTAGQGVVAWRVAERAEDYIANGLIRAALRAGDGSWGAPLNLGYAGATYEDPKAAVDAQGNALVIWARNGLMYAAYRNAGGWQPTTSIASGVEYGNYDVVMNERGDALAVWGDPQARMVSARRPAATGVWSSPVRLPLTSPLNALGAYEGLSFVLDEQGNALLVEGRDDGQVEALTLAAGEEQWQPPLVLGTSGGTSGWWAHDSWCVRPLVALDANGGALAVWGGESLYAARRPAGASGWQEPVVVFAEHSCWGHALAVDATGDAAVLFQTGTDDRRLDATVLDVTRPLVGAVQAPATARAGKPIRLIVSARDLWSRVASVEWRFGDGVRARSGGGRAGDTAVAAVRHAYRRPGHYTVTVTVADQAGNVARRTVRVSVR